MLESPEDPDSDPLSSFLRGRAVLFGGCRRMAAGGLHLSLVTQMKDLSIMSPDARLALQEYRCPDCDALLTYGVLKSNFRCCEYTQLYFCEKCHSNQKFVIPAKILNNWEFKQEPVSNTAYKYLKTIYHLPLICISAINPGIFDTVYFIFII